MTRLPLLARISDKLGRLITHNQSRWDRSALRFERLNNHPREIDFKPQVPIGVANKLSANPYWQRDIRRTIVPDYTVSAQKLLSAEGRAQAAGAPARPGNLLRTTDRSLEYEPQHGDKVRESLANYGTTWP